MRGRISFVVIMFVSCASQAWAQQGNLCEGIQCSGHGRCIVVRDEPACACEGGFISDSSGLNCVSTAPAVAQVVVASVVAPAPVLASAPAPVIEAPPPQPVPAPTPPVPPAPVSVSPRPDRMLRIRLNAPFLSERERPYRDCRVVGMSFAYVGLPLVIVGLVNNFTGFMSEETGLAIDIIGSTVVLTGAILILVGFFRQRHIRREVLAGQVAYYDILRTDGAF